MRKSGRISYCLKCGEKYLDFENGSKENTYTGKIEFREELKPFFNKLEKKFKKSHNNGRD